MSNTNFDFVVDVAKLVTLGLDLSEAAETITSYNEMIETKIADLGTCWSGTDYDALVASFEKYKSSLAVLPALFTAYSSKVGDYDKDGDILITAVDSLLKMSGNRRTTPSRQRNGSSLYSLLDTSGESGIMVEYQIDPDFEKAGDAERQARDIRLNIQADLEVIDVEIYNIDIDIAALEANRDNMDPDVYKAAMEGLTTQRERLVTAREDYVAAQETIDGLLENKFWFWQKDGDLVEASDAWFGLENDRELAASGAGKLNAQLANLTPVDVLCEMSSVNGLYAMGGSDYMMESFSDGPNVSPYAMMASFSVAQNSGETEQSSTNPKVTYFNSKSFIQQGIEEKGAWNTTTDRTFSQMNAYENWETGVESYNGYDSVQINTSDGPVYMTYSQYVNSKYYTEGQGE